MALVSRELRAYLSLVVAIVREILLRHRKKFLHGGYLPVADEDDQGHAIAELVRAGRRSGSVGACRMVSVDFQQVGASYLPLSLSS